MKIKCSDKLPNKEGEYDTDMGKLTLMIHSRDTRIWYIKETIDKITNYKRTQPEWWIEL